MHEAAEEMSITVTDMRAFGDKVFYAVTARGRGKRGAGGGADLVHLDLSRGLVVRLETYVDSADAVEAAGLSA